MHSEKKEQQKERALLTINEKWIQEFAENNYERRLTKEEMELVEEAFFYGDDVHWQIDVLIDEALRYAVKDWR